MIGLTWWFMTDEGWKATKGLTNGTTKIAIITGTAGATAVIYALLGLATAKIAKALCVCSYGILSVIVLLYFIAISIGLLTVVVIPK